MKIKLGSLLLCGLLLLDPAACAANKLTQKIGGKFQYTSGPNNPGPIHGVNHISELATMSGKNNEVTQIVNMNTLNSGTTAETVSVDAVVSGNDNTVGQIVHLSDTNKDGTIATVTQKSNVQGNDNDHIDQTIETQRLNDVASKTERRQEMAVAGDENKKVTQDMKDFGQDKNTASQQVTNFYAQKETLVGNENMNVHQEICAQNNIDDATVQFTQEGILNGNDNNKISQKIDLADTVTGDPDPNIFTGIFASQQGIVAGNRNEKVGQEFETSRTVIGPGNSQSSQFSNVQGNDNQETSQSQVLRETDDDGRSNFIQQKSIVGDNNKDVEQKQIATSLSKNTGGSSLRNIQGFGISGSNNKDIDQTQTTSNQNDAAFEENTQNTAITGDDSSNIVQTFTLNNINDHVGRSEFSQVLSVFQGTASDAEQSLNFQDTNRNNGVGVNQGLLLQGGSNSGSQDMDSESTNIGSSIARIQDLRVNGDDNNPHQGMVVQEDNNGRESVNAQRIAITGNGHTEFSQNLVDFDTNSGSFDLSDQNIAVTGNDNAVSQNLQTENVNSNGVQVTNNQALTINGNENDATQQFDLAQTNNGGVVDNEQVNQIDGDNNVLVQDIPTSRRILRGAN